MDDSGNDAHHLIEDELETHAELLVETLEPSNLGQGWDTYGKTRQLNAALNQGIFRLGIRTLYSESTFIDVENYRGERVLVSGGPKDMTGYLSKNGNARQLTSFVSS